MSYPIEVSRREAKCKHCPLKINKGGVRIYSSLKKNQLFYHPSCFFKHIENLDGNADIQNVDSFIGVTDLETPHLQQLIDLVAEYNRKKTLCNSAATQNLNPNAPPFYPNGVNSIPPIALLPGGGLSSQGTSSTPHPVSLGTVPVVPVGTVPVGSVPVGSVPVVTVGTVPVVPVGTVPVGSVPVFTVGTVVTEPLLNSSLNQGESRMGNIVNSFGLVQPSTSSDPISQGNRVNVIVSPNSSGNVLRSASISSGPILISSDEEGDANNPTTSNKGKTVIVPGSLTCTSTPKQAPSSFTSTPKAASTASVTGPPTKRQRTNENTSENEDETVCSICLDPPVHPVKLPCDHVYCYLCAKGLVLCDRFQVTPQCSLCRQDFNPSHLESSIVLQEASSTLNNTPPIVDLNTQQALDEDDRWQWFYQGNKGWWRFERRNNEDIEKSYLQGEQSTELLIVGKLYTIDFVRMEQYQKQFPQRKRQIKRDLRSTQCKGVAGLVKSSNRKPHVN